MAGSALKRAAFLFLFLAGTAQANNADGSTGDETTCIFVIVEPADAPEAFFSGLSTHSRADLWKVAHAGLLRLPVNPQVAAEGIMLANLLGGPELSGFRDSFREKLKSLVGPKPKISSDGMLMLLEQVDFLQATDRATARLLFEYMLFLDKTHPAVAEAADRLGDLQALTALGSDLAQEAQTAFEADPNGLVAPTLFRAAADALGRLGQIPIAQAFLKNIVRLMGSEQCLAAPGGGSACSERILTALFAASAQGQRSAGRNTGSETNVRYSLGQHQQEQIAFIGQAAERFFSRSQSVTYEEMEAVLSALRAAGDVDRIHKLAKNFLAVASQAASEQPADVMPNIGLIWGSPIDPYIFAFEFSTAIGDNRAASEALDALMAAIPVDSELDAHYRATLALRCNNLGVLDQLLEMTWDKHWEETHAWLEKRLASPPQELPEVKKRPIAELPMTAHNFRDMALLTLAATTAVPEHHRASYVDAAAHEMADAIRVKGSLLDERLDGAMAFGLRARHVGAVRRSLERSLAQHQSDGPFFQRDSHYRRSLKAALAIAAIEQNLEAPAKP
ncbi:hypothetical protein K2X33_11940 [bacterium]|nr:hypothetical protein [bacterium]